MKRRDFNKMLLGAGAGASIGLDLGLPGAGLFRDGVAYAQRKPGGLTAIIFPEPPVLTLPLNQQIPVGTIGGKIYESLLDYDFELKPRPQLAERWEISPDGLTYTFHLVKNAKWHDGKPFTSADVVFSCNVMLKESNPYCKLFYYFNYLITQQHGESYQISYHNSYHEIGALSTLIELPRTHRPERSGTQIPAIGLPFHQGVPKR